MYVLISNFTIAIVTGMFHYGANEISNGFV